MKRHRSQKPARGAALVMVFMVLAVVVTMIVALLQTTTTNASLVDNTRDRYQALLLAQAGINHAVAELDSGKTFGGTSHAVGSPSRNWGMQQGYSVTTVQNLDGSLTITSIGTYQYVAYGTSDQGNVTLNNIVNYDRQVHRKLVAVAMKPSINGGFPAGMFGKAGVTMVGNANTDSYNTNLGTTYAQQVAAAGGQAKYDATIGAGGNVGSNLSISGSGNIVVHGNATPGPGNSVSLSGGATVTGTTTAAATTYNAPPYVYKLPSGSITQASYGGGSQTFGPGTLEFSSDIHQTGGTITFAAGITNVYFDANFRQSGKGAIVLAAGATVNIFQAASASFDMSGQGVTNATNIPSNFNVVSASTSGVSVTGQGHIYATVYAPDASVQVSGNGEFYGALIGNTVSVNGNAAFHYDTAATSPGIVTNLMIVSEWESDL